MLWEARHISISIDRPPSDVYAFASRPENMPKWASGVAGALRQIGGRWIADAPMGQVTITFSETNPYGVLDHDVTLPSGMTVHNAMRVLPNGRGSEVVFSLFRLPGTSEEKFAADGQWVTKDLLALKALLESARQ